MGVVDKVIHVEEVDFLHLRLHLELAHQGDVLELERDLQRVLDLDVDVDLLTYVGGPQLSIEELILLLEVVAVPDLHQLDRLHWNDLILLLSIELDQRLPEFPP